MKKTTLLLGLALFGLSFFASQKAQAADCFNDPVYERNFSAKATVGSRVRSVACMEGSDILTVLPAGTVVPVIAETDGWYKVKAGDKIGWVGSQLLEKTDKAISPINQQNGKVTKAKGTIGVSEKDYEKLKNGNKALIKRLKNMIVLRVHDKGQAYLVKDDGKLLYFKNMKEMKDYLEPKAKPSPAVSTLKPISETLKIGEEMKIFLKANLVDPGKVKLEWATEGVDVSKGFKTVISESANPVYPGNEYHYLSNPAARSDYWTGLGNKTYHFRVCQYLGGACGAYSNDVTVTVATNGALTEDILPGSITLSATALEGGNVALVWNTTGMTAPQGFKVVISEQANPVYPGNEYHYFSEPDKNTDVWSGLIAGKTYNFRVCQYLGGYCGTYSNNMAVTAK